MDFFDIVDQRYSYKQAYAETPVPMEHLEKIAKAGLAAPTGINSQCVSMIILDRNALSKLCEVVMSEGLRTAPAAIMLMTDPDTQTGLKNFEMEDYSAAAANMYLAATALGYASVWLDAIFFDPAVQDEVKKVFSIPERFHIRVVLPIGIPAFEETRRPKKPFEERVFYNRYLQKKP